MIDLHCHVLPGLDDGPPDMDASFAMARTAAAAGTTTIVATPHVREDYSFPLEAIADGADELSRALDEEGIELRLLTGAEVAISKALELDGPSLRALCLGAGPYILIESPYVHATEILETALFDLQVEGLRPVLAHPERSAAFLEEPARLERLVERGALCSVTAISMSGRFGEPVRRFTTDLFSKALVHNVASDAHDDRGRGPDLRVGFDALDGELPGAAAQSHWFTSEAPAAIVEGRDLPTHPGVLEPRRRRLLRRGLWGP